MARRHVEQGEGHVARQKALIAKLDRDGLFARESIFQHILEIPFKQSGLLGKILLDRPRRPRDW